MWQKGLRGEGRLFTTVILFLAFCRGSYILCRTICLVTYMKHHRHNSYRSSSCLSRGGGESKPWGFFLPSESRWPWKDCLAQRQAGLLCSPRLGWQPFPGSPGSGVVSRPSLWPGRVGRNKGALGPGLGAWGPPHRSLHFHPGADLRKLNTAVRAGEGRHERRNLGS